MPEGYLQVSRRLDLVPALRGWFARRGVEDAWVCCDNNVYYREGDPRAVVAPDVAVAFGVDAAAQESRSTFRVWEAGVAPCFVLEILSPGTLENDLRKKPGIYAELGVREYWRLDPTGGELMDPPLLGERRRGGRWVRVGAARDGGWLRARSELLGLDLCWRWPRLRLWDVAAGEWLPDSLNEQIALADQQAARATREAARADQQAARADDEAAARRAAESRAGEEAAARRAAESRAGEEAARADGEAAARRVVEAELAELRARLGGGS